MNSFTHSKFTGSLVFANKSPYLLAEIGPRRDAGYPLGVVFPLFFERHAYGPVAADEHAQDSVIGDQKTLECEFHYLCPPRLADASSCILSMSMILSSFCRSSFI